MSASVGILLDVSGSMQRSYDDGISRKSYRTWAHSIFQVISDVVRFDLLDGNRVFALAFGGAGENVMFDILRTLEKLQIIGFHGDLGQPAEPGHIEEFLSFLEKNGVRTIRRWVEVAVISKVVDDYTLMLALNELKSNEEFKNYFIQNILPPEARSWLSEPEVPDTRFGSFRTSVAQVTQSIVAAVATNFRKASEEDIIEIVNKSRPKLLENASPKSVLTALEALQIVHGSIDKQELTAKRSEDLYNAVKPFIFGNTPLCTTLKKSVELFMLNDQTHVMKKILFVLSDGHPTDKTSCNVEAIKTDLSNLNVYVVCCFISRQKVKSKTLYSELNPDWRDGAKFLFNLSSSVPTQQLPCAILMKRKWEIQTANNETKLFMQVNNPDNVREACELARSVVNNQDALSDLLATVSLDMYINQDNEGLKAMKQEGGTCYAYASATVLHLSMKRILGRKNGYPDFQDLREELIQLYGREGAYPIKVLQDICPKYRLRCKKVALQDALKAITEKRPIVATFYLAESEMKKFERYFEDRPTGVLTKKDIDIRQRNNRERLLGHVVVLTSFNSQCLRLMNSWGDDWGDLGFFRVQSADVLNFEFIDVFWETGDLLEQEKVFYREHGSAVANELLENYTELQSQMFRCPECKKESLVSQFEGTLRSMLCPLCKGFFSCNNAGNMLAMKLYLLSLSR